MDSTQDSLDYGAGQEALGRAEDQCQALAMPLSAQSAATRMETTSSVGQVARTSTATDAEAGSPWRKKKWLRSEPRRALKSA